VCSECSEEVGEEGALSWHCGIHESVLLFSHIKEKIVEDKGYEEGDSMSSDCRVGSRTDPETRRQSRVPDEQDLESEALCRPLWLVEGQSRVGGFFPAREASRRCFTRFI
jgi:hypothetical protein